MESSAIRKVNDTARALTIYGLLLGGAAVFSLPFLWMIGTSFKVDREMFGDRITFFPMRPVPAVSSPYLDTRYFPEPKDERAAGMVRALLGAMELRLDPNIPDRDAALDVLAPGIVHRLRQMLPTDTWTLPDEQLRSAIQGRLTPELIDETLRKVYRRLSFGPLRVRSLDLQEKDVTMGRLHSEFWDVDGAAASIADRRDEGNAFGDLVYNFAAGDGDIVRLAKTIDLPFPVDRLHRIQLYIRPDDSWHRAEFEVEMKGKRFKGKRPEFMGNFQWTVVTLQEYGPDDESTKIRFWIPLMEQKTSIPALDDPAQVRISVSLERVNAFQAWWAKCQRNYRGALDYIPFWRYTATSVFLVILNIVCTLASCSLVAFSFARLQWPGRNICFGIMLATMMIPAQVTMIPYFLIIKHLGWYNTLKPLWVVSLCGNAFNIFLLRQFMKGIPRDLEDAARIDGCSSFQVYLHVILPLVKPTLACIAIFTFMGVWNDFMGPLIYLSDQRLYPLSLGLYAFNVQSGGSFGMMMAGSLLMTMPVVAIFFFAQKYFIQGVTLTGMKG
jgi:multiple sugar transport system permease protein